ncbi:hypothetical protein [uncultured Nostoc sp.]|uniref:hypothetical protein n=1 Tax=uncultured Nostoc sp. TaxID=340711 RepID=UPI0035CAC9A8
MHKAVAAVVPVETILALVAVIAVVAAIVAAVVIAAVVDPCRGRCERRDCRACCSHHRYGSRRGCRSCQSCCSRRTRLLRPLLWPSWLLLLL